MPEQNPMDEDIDFIVQRLVDMVKDIPEDVPPLGNVKLTREEKIQRYAEMRENPQAWQDLLDEHGLKAVVHEATKLEKQYQEWLKEAEGDEQRRSAESLDAPRPGV